MKSTGMVRKVDELGRIVLPKELRTTMGIEIRDPLEVWVDGDIIQLRKYSCAICSGMEDLTDFKGLKICRECKDELTAG